MVSSAIVVSFLRSILTNAESVLLIFCMSIASEG